MRAKYTLYLPLFVVLFLSVSQHVFGQATFNNARHETVSQTQILVTLNAPGVTWGAGPYSTVGWFVEINGANVPVTSIAPFGSNILVTFDASGIAGHGGTQPFVKPGEVLTVRYAGGGQFNAAALTPFGFQTSQNNTVFSCAELTFIQQGIIPGATPDICAPVVMNFFQFIYTISLRFRNSSNYNLANMRYAINWGDATATDAFPYQSDAFGAASPGFINNNPGNPTVNLTARPTHNYPATTTPANPGICSWDILLTPYYNGVATCFSLARVNAFATYDTDNANSGTLNLPPSVTNSNLVCLGNNVNMQFSDNTALNCRVAVEPGLPNDLGRWIRITYGSQNNGGVGNVPDVFVTLPAILGGGPPIRVTNNDATGTRVGGTSYTPTNVGAADFNGVITLPTPVNAATATQYMAQITTTLTNNQAVGQRFYVRLDYWDECNKYNPGSPNSPAPVSIQNFVEIIDSPNPPTVNSPNVCETTGNGSYNITATGAGAGTLTYTWYLDAAMTTVLQGPSTDNTFNPVTEGPVGNRINPAVSGSQTFNRYVTVTQGSNNCTSQPRTITIRIDDQNTAGAIAHPLGASPIIVCSGTDPAAFTSTTAGTGGGPDGPDAGTDGDFVYQWQSATNAAFTAGVTNIPGATAATFDPPAVTGTIFYRRQVISGNCAAVNTAVFEFRADTPVQAGAISGTQTICTGQTPTTLGNTTPGSGGNGTPSYTWQQSTDNFAADINTVAGATGATYSPGALTVTTSYRRINTSGVCVPTFATTAPVTVTVQPVINPGAVAGNQTICSGGDPAAFTSTTAATGGNGALVYRWQSSTTSAVAGFANITPAATADVYDPPTGLTQTTWYRRVATGGACTEQSTPAIQVTVNPLPTAANPTGGGAVCGGNPAPNIQWTLTGAPPFNFTYTVRRNGTLIATVPVTNYNPAGPPYVFTITDPNPPTDYAQPIVAGDVYAYQFTALSDNVSGSPSCAATALGTARNVTIGGTPPAFATGPSINPAEVCVNGGSTTNPQLSFTLTLGSSIAGNYTLTYRINAGANQTKTFTVNPATGALTTTLEFAEAALDVAGTHTIRLVSIESPSSCLTPLTDQFNFIVRPLPVIGTQPTAQEVCASSGTATFTVAATGTALEYQWQEQVGGVGPFNNITNGGVYAGATAATLTLTNPPIGMSTNRYQVVVRSVFPTTFSCPVTSNAVALTVRPFANITAQPPNRAICSGDATTFTVTANVAGPSVITGYQWQISTTGPAGAYSNLTNGAPYSNVTTATMTITGATTVLNGNHYRVIVTTTGSCPLPSSPGSLTVNPLPASNAIAPIVCEDINHFLGSPSVGAGQANNVDLTQYSVAIADAPGAPVEIPAGVQVRYYASAANRLTDTSPITSATILNGTQIFVRTSITATGCYVDQTVTFTLRSQPPPTNHTVQICEDNPPGSLVASNINLTSYEATVTASATNRDVEWYRDQALTDLIDPGTLPNQDQNYSIAATTTLFAKIIDTTPGTPGCHSVAELRLEYQPRPNLNEIKDGAGVPVGATYTVCASNNLVFLQIDPTINPGSTYTWNVPTPPASPMDPGYFELLTGTSGFFIILRFPSLNPSPGVPISVTERLGTAGCAGTTLNTSIIVEGSPPTPIITGPSTVCANSTATYSVPSVAGNSYSWSVPPGATITSTPVNSNTIDVVMSTFNGNVNVVVSNSTGCLSSGTVPLPVTVVTKPAMTSPTAATLCSGQAPDDVHTLTATLGGTTYRWEVISILGFVNGVAVGDTDGSVVGSNTPGAANIDGRTLTNTSGVNAAVIYRIIPVSPPTAGVYCEGNQQNVTITIQPEPNLLLAPKTVCSDEPANYEIRLSTPGLPTGTLFTWSAPVMSDGSTQGTGGTNVPAGPTGTIHINDSFLNTSSGTITATYTISAVSGAGCTGNQAVADRQVVITVNPKPLISTTLDKPVCSDEAIALTLNTAGASTVTAANYTIVSQTIDSDLDAHAGNATVPQANVPANYLAGDKFTNTSGGPLLVTYTVNAISSIGGCQGPDQVITITINSGPTTNAVTDEVCSDVAGGNTHVEDLEALEPLVNPDGTLIFEWYTDAAATSAIGTPTAYPLQNGVPVYVKVHNGVGTCAKIQEVEYVVNPTPAVTASITSNYNGFNVRCIGSADGTITANVATLGTPNYTYSVDGSNFFTGRIFNGLAASNNPFTVTVRDAKGCTATSGSMTLTEPPVMTAVNAVTSNLLPTHNGRDLTCPGASDGQITVTAGGGTGSGYSYRIIETNATNTTGVFNGLPQGVYTVIVTDKAPNNCTVTSNQVTITPPPVINASATLTDAASCNGASDGEITAIASGGTLVAPNNYLFTINPGATSNNTGVFTGLASSGVPYTVTVRDDNGCTVQSNGVVVTQPAAISAFISVNTSLYPGGSAISCFGANDAQLNVTANGGNGGYTYVLNVVTPGAANTTGDATGTYDGVNPGAYTATVTDSRGCNITSGQVTVAQPADINVQQFITQAISCNGDDDGQIRLVATGGTGAFTFTRTGGPPAPTPEANGTGIFSNLSEFNYPFEVNDINGCTKTLSIALTDPDPVVLSFTVQTPHNGAQISCPTSKDGIVQLTTAGGNGNFTYSITNPILAPPNNTGATSGIFNGLGAGTYTFHVVDPKGCNDSEDVTITPPAPVTISAPTKTNYNGQDVSCTNLTDGTVTVLAGGGTPAPAPPPYTYVLSPSSNNSGQTTGQFTNVGPGTYTVTAFDGNNCSVTSTSITINPYAAITFPGAAVVQYNGREISCNGAADGRINSTPSGGAGGWTNYTISPTPGTAVNGGNGVFTGLPAGSYVITAQDANACPSSTASITVHQPDVLVASAAVQSQPTCFNLDNASVRVSAVGGTVNYVFSINTTPSAMVSPAVPSQHTFTGVAPNPAYTVTVTDVNGCTDDVAVDPIVAPSQPLITASITSDDIAAYHNQHITCFGANDAIITALHTAGTGTGSLTYTITGPGSNTTGQFTGVFTLLGPGGFNVTATDINGCASNSVPLTVIEPPQLQATLSSGTDFNGFDIRCFNEQNGIIIVTPSGGTGDPMTADFQYVLMQSPGTPVDFSNGDVRFNNLRAMQYQARVRDLNGCTIITTPPFELFQPTQITLSAAVTSNYGADGTDISCVGANDGEISVVATIAGGVDTGGSPGSGIADYTYAINPADNTTGATSGVFTGLRPNTLYTITATDANSCTANAFPVIMFEPTNLFAGFVGSSHDICIDQANKTTQPFTELQGAFGGNGSYEYRWMQSTVANPVWPADYTPVGGATAPTYTAPTNLATTTHYVREVRTTSATSALSCPTLASNKLTITVNPRPTVTIAPAGPICQGTPFGLSFNFTGSAPFTFDYDMLETGSPGPPVAQNNQIASNSRMIFINDYQEETTFTVTRVVDRNECEALPITLVPREFMAQSTVPIIKVLADLTVTSPNPQCSGETFTFDYTVDPDVTYTFTWPDGEVETITPAMATGTISRVIESLNTGSTTQFPIILLASHVSCQPLTAVELIDVYPRILTNVIPSADRVCSDSPAYPSPIMVTNNTLGGQDHKWTVTRISGVGAPDEIINDPSTTDAIDKVFRITNTTAENPAEYRVDYVVTNDATNGSCQVSESFNVFVYKEAIAKIGTPKDPLLPIEFWGMNTTDHGVFNPATPAMEIEFQNATPPLSADFQQTWTFSNNNPNTPPQSFVDSNPTIMYPYRNPGTGKRAILNIVNQVALADGVMSGCPTRDEFVFTIQVPPLSAAFTVSDPACLGTPDATIRVVNNSTGGTITGSDFVSYWEVRDHNNIVIYTSNLREPTFPMTTAGRYSIYLTVSNPEGATPPSSFGPLVVDIYPNPLASFITSPSNMVFIPEQVLRTDNRSLSGTDPLTNTPYPIYYVWDFGDNSDEIVSVINPSPSDPNSGHSPTHRYTTEDASLTITLRAVNDHGGGLECSSTVTQAMQARSQGTSKVPNAFTPNPGGPNGGIVNEDGTTINDVFLPITKGIKEFKMQIFDRWGNLVFESQQQNRGWDGYDRNGNLMPAGVYVYKLVLRMANDQRTTQVGDVTLIR